MLQIPGTLSNIDRSRRIPVLDLLRIIAVTLVVGRHLLFIPDTLPHSLQAFFLFWRKIGWCGVDLFFVLSGFLVSGLIFDEYKQTKNFDFVRFFVRRSFKILPPFWVLIFVTYLLKDFFFYPDINFPSLPFKALRELLFVQNYVGGMWAHTWSLGVEEHFYFLLSVVLLLIIRYSHRSMFHRILIMIIAIGIISPLIFRCMKVFLSTTGEAISTLTPSHFRIDSLFIGVLLSYFNKFIPEALALKTTWRWICASTIVIGGLCLPMLFDLSPGEFLFSVGFTGIALGCAALIQISLALGRGIRWDHWIVSILTRLGEHSYSLYLWHLPAYVVAYRWTSSAMDSTSAFAATLILYPTLTVILGELSYFLVERPALSLRRTLWR